MNECTFSPKLNKSVNYDNMTINTDFSKIDSKMLSLINRQELWNQKKKRKKYQMKILKKII